MRKLTLIALLALAAQAADTFPPSAEQKREISGKISVLDAQLKSLRAKHADAALIADVEVYRKAAQWIARYPEEFYTKVYAPNAIAVLDKGLARAKELESGAPSWPKQK